MLIKMVDAKLRGISDFEFIIDWNYTSCYSLSVYFCVLYARIAQRLWWDMFTFLLLTLWVQILWFSDLLPLVDILYLFHIYFLILNFSLLLLLDREWRKDHPSQVPFIKCWSWFCNRKRWCNNQWYSVSIWSPCPVITQFWVFPWDIG